jgi:hypothetical protein
VLTCFSMIVIVYLLSLSGCCELRARSSPRL